MDEETQDIKWSIQYLEQLQNQLLDRWKPIKTYITKPRGTTKMALKPP